MTDPSDSRFKRYAGYYDLLYRDKDYAAEAQFVASVLESHAPRPGALEILDLGCGTARHARLLAARGHRVHGVDVSPRMVERARHELAGDAADVQNRVELSVGDVREVRLGRRFAAVISLFHVMSYQTARADFDAALATARAHLEPGGLFVFDAWYGPGVLTDPPSVRVKRVSGPEYSVLRLSEPDLRPSDNRVDVNFTVFVFSAADVVAEVVRETHSMRYWFAPEVAEAAEMAGFEVVELAEWMTRDTPKASTWNAHWVLRAVS